MLSWFKAGSRCKIDGSVVSKVSTGWNCAYGNQEVSSGKHEWKVKVISSQYGCIKIGITSNTKWAESKCWQKGDTYCYVYYGYSGKKVDKSDFTAYSEPFGSSDIITV
eukprot:309690_1